MKNSKRGTTMVEAAIVFPLVIASVVAVIYLMINLYCLTARQAALHVNVRSEAAAQSGVTDVAITDGAARDRYRRASERIPGETQRHTNLLRPYVFAESEKTYYGNALVSGGVSRKSGGRFYVIDEGELTRRTVFVKGLLGAS